MGKPKNSAQEAIMVKFMQKHQDVANNVFAGDKVALDTLWEEFSQKLNRAGPPMKDPIKWKKVWTDWKANIQKKIVHTKLENDTGGAFFNKHVLTPGELLISNVCDFDTPVEAIRGTLSFGITSDEEESIEMPLPIDTKTWIETPSVLNTPSLKRQAETTYVGRPKKHVLEPVQTNIVDESESLQNIVPEVEEGIEPTETSWPILREMEQNLRNVSKSLDNFDHTLKSIHDEQKRNNHAVEKMLLEQNKIKKRQLDIMEIELKLKLKLKSKA